MKSKFYKCNTCGKIIEICNDITSIPTICCNNEMEELTPLSSDIGNEKHVPLIEIDKSNNVVKVTVGSILHPYIESHHIVWIRLDTSKGSYIRNLSHTEEPIAIFHIDKEEEIYKAYAYCNIHSLWVSK